MDKILLEILEKMRHIEMLRTPEDAYLSHEVIDHQNADNLLLDYIEALAQGLGEEFNNLEYEEQAKELIKAYDAIHKWYE